MSRQLLYRFAESIGQIPVKNTTCSIFMVRSHSSEGFIRPFNQRSNRMNRNSNSKSNVIAWFLAGVIGGMALAYSVKSIVDFNKRESHEWERAWENSSYPLIVKLEKDDPDDVNGESSDIGENVSPQAQES